MKIKFNVPAAASLNSCLLRRHNAKATIEIKATNPLTQTEPNRLALWGILPRIDTYCPGYDIKLHPVVSLGRGTF